MTTGLTQYPISIGGNKQFGVYDHTGPASYQTGGETVPASDFGMATVDSVTTPQAQGYTLSGNYIVVVLYALALDNQSVILAWYYASSGQQVAQGTNLAGEHIRLEAKGV